MRIKVKMQYKICVSGAAAGKCLGLETKKKAEQIGRAIARAGSILMTGATTGLPFFASRGAKQAGGLVFGFSPAASQSEHVRKYRLPVDYADAIIFTGAGYAGRNLILTRSSDAVIVICGRIGTLNEFTVAYEDKKVIGVLKESGGIAGELDELLAVAKRGRQHIIFEADPQRLIRKVIKEIKRANRRHRVSFHRDNA